MSISSHEAFKLGNFIDGEFAPPAGGRYIESFDPSTGRVHHFVPDSDSGDVAAAVEAARKAAPKWARTPVEERARLLNRVADIIDSRRKELAEAESRDQGKPVWLAASMDIPRAALNFRFFAGEILHHQESASRSESTPPDATVTSTFLNYTNRKPVGVAGLISPWNLPLYLLTWKIAPAIAAGNTCVCKPSELTSLTAWMLGSILNDAGVPPGVVNIVFGRGPSAGQALVEHPDVPLISFTGGTSTGETLARTAAPMLKKLSLELGGKNPNIIFADADIEEAAATSVRSSFLNQGEICLCGSRIFVHEKAYEPFLKAFREHAAKLRVGDPRDKATFIGPVVSKDHQSKILSYVELARKEGAGFVLGADQPGLGGAGLEGDLSGGYFVRPVIVTDLPPTSRVCREEIFGPFVTVTPFFFEDEAIALANGVKYGLSASVWTKDLARAHRMAERLDAGTVWINCWMVRDLRMPFGGMKSSGIGREGGRHSLEFFTETRNVCVRY